MLNVYLIYKKDHSLKNKTFINYLTSHATQKNINLTLKYYEDFDDYKFDKVDGVINRTNDYKIATHFESLGVQVFNNSNLSLYANDKNLCYDLMQKNDIPIQKVYTSIDNISFPVVVKNPHGSGGNEVYLINNHEELKPYYEKNFCIQEFLKDSKKDLRVYVIGNKVILALLRFGHDDFRANYSISKDAQIYNLNESDLEMVNKIVSLFNIDYAGIDFLLDKNNKLFFNEIEDSVGARAIYEKTNIDIAKLFIEHVYQKLK